MVRVLTRIKGADDQAPAPSCLTSRCRLQRRRHPARGTGRMAPPDEFPRPTHAGHTALGPLDAW